MTEHRTEPYINEEDINIGADDHLTPGYGAPSARWWAEEDTESLVQDNGEQVPTPSDNGIRDLKTKCEGLNDISGSGQAPMVQVLPSAKSMEQNGGILTDGEPQVVEMTPMSNGRMSLSDNKFYSPFILRPQPGEGQTFPGGQGLIFKQIPQETLEVKRKIEKKKAKRAAGWTKAGEMTNHVELQDIGDILNFVGEEADKEASALQNAAPKRKLKKKLSSRQKAAENKLATMNGTAGSQSSSCSDSEEIEPQSVNGYNSEPTEAASRPVSASKSSKPLTNGFDHLVDTAADIDGNGVQNPDTEFTEVLHKKKKTVNRNNINSAASNSDRSVKSSNHIHNNRPPIQSGNLARTGGLNHGAAAKPHDYDKPTQSPPKEDIDVDLSISSFPALGPQTDNKSSSHNESTSATDDDNSSVSSQPVASGPSWAKIAAKPTITNTPQKYVVEIFSAQVVKPVESYCGEQTSQDNQQQDLTANSTTGNTISVAMTNPPSNKVVSSVGGCEAVVANVEPLVLSSAPNKELERPDNSLAITESSNIQIEFGTVTSSNDSESDQKIQNILSNSYAEGLSLYNLSQQIKKQVPTISKPSFDPKRIATKSKPYLSASKGVQFLDRPAGVASPKKAIGILFGFDTTDTVAQRTDIQTQMSMSYPPPNNPARSQTRVELSPSYADQHQYSTAATNNQPISIPTTKHSDVETGASAAIAANILHKIMSTDSTSHKVVKKHQPWELKKAEGRGDCNGFDIYATIKMLRKEWDYVMQQRNKQNGARHVRYLKELQRSD